MWGKHGEVHVGKRETKHWWLPSEWRYGPGENVFGDGNGQDCQFRFLSGTDATPGSFVGVGMGFVSEKGNLVSEPEPRMQMSTRHPVRLPWFCVLRQLCNQAPRNSKHPGDGFFNVVADARVESQSTGSGVQNTQWTEWVLAIDPQQNCCVGVSLGMRRAPVMWSVLE